MPNGGSDNCERCAFNAHAYDSQGNYLNPSERSTPEGHCLVRQVPIPNPHWTYCENGTECRPRKPEPRDVPSPVGPIYGSGLYEQGCSRVPWHGDQSPFEAESGTCTICGKQDGPVLVVPLAAEDTGGSRFAVFCCNEHYREWWKERNPGVQLVWR